MYNRFYLLAMISDMKTIIILSVIHQMRQDTVKV